MSENRQKLRIQAEKRWPTLYQFLAGYVHQNWDSFYDSPEEAIDDAVSDFTLEMRKNVAEEWIDWKQRVVKKTDPRGSLNDGFGVNVFFRKPQDARNFVKMVEEKINASIDPTFKTDRKME